jgi:hypothetical protein
MSQTFYNNCLIEVAPSTDGNSEEFPWKGTISTTEGFLADFFISEEWEADSEDEAMAVAKFIADDIIDAAVAMGKLPREYHKL